MKSTRSNTEKTKSSRSITKYNQQQKPSVIAKIRKKLIENIVYFQKFSNYSKMSNQELIYIQKRMKQTISSINAQLQNIISNRSFTIQIKQHKQPIDALIYDEQLKNNHKIHQNLKIEYYNLKNRQSILLNTRVQDQLQSVKFKIQTIQSQVKELKLSKLMLGKSLIHQSQYKNIVQELESEIMLCQLKFNEKNEKYLLILDEKYRKEAKNNKITNAAEISRKVLTQISEDERKEAENTILRNKKNKLESIRNELRSKIYYDPLRHRKNLDSKLDDLQDTISSIKKIQFDIEQTDQRISSTNYKIRELQKQKPMKRKKSNSYITLLRELPERKMSQSYSCFPKIGDLF